MNVLVVLAHPDSGSFNHALAQNACNTLRDNGHEVVFHDLYDEGFDPLLPAGEIPRGAKLPGDIARHCAEVAGADGIIIVHPNWWGMPPAVLTGWVDRVMRPGTTYEFIEGDDGEGVPVGLLKADKAIVFNTSNTEKTRKRSYSRSAGTDMEGLHLQSLRGEGDPSSHVPDHSHLHAEERRQWLREARVMVEESFPRTPDQNKRNCHMPAIIR